MDRTFAPEFVLVIAERAARRHGATLEEVLEGCRQSHAMLARREVIQELRRRKPRPSTRTIGRWMGLHHTTVLHALSQMEVAE